MKLIKVIWTAIKCAGTDIIEKANNKEKILSLLKAIPSGTFNYKKYRKQYRGKTISPIDIPFEFVSQLPFLKLITYPISGLIYFAIIISYLIYVYTADTIKCKLQQLRRKKEA